ncbi:MAG TPA: ABC transporter permease [Vicinamibacterales bacterium]
MAFEQLWQDTRYAVRSYARTPVFTSAVLMTLALGIGASTAIFSMVNSILLKPLPLNDPNRLVFATEVNARGGTMSLSWLNYLDWRERARSFDVLAASRDESQTLTGVERAQRLRARRVTSNFFTVLGVPAAIGRGLTEADDRPNAEPAVVVSDEFWRTQLGADPAAVGRSLNLNARLHTIVGVLPRGFEYLRPYDVFVSVGQYAGSEMLLRRGNHNGFSAVGRLKPGVSVEGADAELRGISLALEREHPDTNTGVRAHAELLSERLVSGIKLTLLALLGAVGCLLVIACVNVANLLIARGAARRHELAVRAALGGGRGRLMSQLLVESTLVSATGGALGILLAYWLLRILVGAAPDGTPRVEGVGLDGAALVFALAASAICGLVFGAFPAYQASSVDSQQTLVRGRANAFSAGSHRLRRGLMMAETALALILLVGAGLMIRTLQRATSVDTGFKPDHLVTAQFILNGEEWTDARQHGFRDTLLDRLRALPGVTRAALTFALPIDGSQWNSIFIVSGKPVPERAQLPSAAFTPVSTEYFETVGMRLLRGRYFERRDRESSSPVAVVNESFASRMWPGEDPIGRTLKQGWPEDKGDWREVIGVVADVKFNGITSETPLQVYLPLDQVSMRYLAIVARTASDAEALMPSIESVVHDLDTDLPLYGKRTMDQMLESSLARERMSTIVFMLFAAVAVALAAIGLYGVVSHSVTERTHEIGVRMALGADPRHVLALVVGQGLMTAVAGIVIGLVGALALSRTIEGLLFGVRSTDPVTFAGVAALLLGIALTACAVPGWRATRVDPTRALRAE